MVVVYAHGSPSNQTSPRIRAPLPKTPPFVGSSQSKIEPSNYPGGGEFATFEAPQTEEA